MYYFNDKYKELKESILLQEDLFLVIVLVNIVFVLFSIAYTIYLGIYLRQISKRDKQLEKIVNSLTGKDFKIYIIPTTEVNAFNMGGKNIYIYGGLYKMLNKREIIAICLHEAAHYINYDVITGVIQEPTLKLFFIKLIFVLAPLMSIPVPFLIIAMFLLHSASYGYISRMKEKRADDYAIEHGYGKDLASALEKIRKMMNVSKKESTWDKVTEIIHSHPNIQKRIEYAMKQDKMYKEIAKAKSPIEATAIMLRYVGVSEKVTNLLKSNSKFKSLIDKVKKYFKKFNFKII